MQVAVFGVIATLGLLLILAQIISTNVDPALASDNHAASFMF